MVREIEQKIGNMLVWLVQHLPQCESWPSWNATITFTVLCGDCQARDVCFS